MRILFIQTNMNSTNSFAFSFGVNSLSSVLKQYGHLTKYYLATSILEKEIEYIKAMTESFSPDVIGFTSVTSQFRYVKRLSNELKKFFDGLIICGGIHPTLEPECLEEAEGLDGIVRGEGEFAVLELLEALRKKEEFYSINNFWFKKNGNTQKNDLRPYISNLDILPFPDTDICDWQKLADETQGRLRFMFSRGCLYRCSYCSNHAIQKIYGSQNLLRFRSADKCIEEIRIATSKYKFDHLYFGEDTFTINKRWALDFLKLYRENFNYPFGCQMRADLCTKELFYILKEAGCFLIMMGVEAGNDDIRNKILKRNMTREQIIDAFKTAQRVGIKTSAQVMIGVPYETNETVKETIKLIAELNPDEIRHGVFLPYPGTELQQLCFKEGFLKNENYQQPYSERLDSILEMPGITREEIRDWNENFLSCVKEEIRKRGEESRCTIDDFFNRYKNR